MRKNFLNWIIIINLILIILVIFFKDSQKNLLELFNLIVLSLTFCAIVYYTIETCKLRKVTQDQLKLNMLPIISIEGIGQSSFKIKNIGKSPAFNIFMEEVERYGFGSNSSKKYYFEFINPITVINVGETKEVEIKIISPNSGLQNPNPDPFLDPFNSNFKKEYFLKIHCKDIKNNNVFSVFEVNKKEISLKNINYRNKK